MGLCHLGPQEARGTLGEALTYKVFYPWATNPSCPKIRGLWPHPTLKVHQTGPGALEGQGELQP